VHSAGDRLGHPSSSVRERREVLGTWSPTSDHLLQEQLVMKGRRKTRGETRGRVVKKVVPGGGEERDHHEGGKKWILPATKKRKRARSSRRSEKKLGLGLPIGGRETGPEGGRGCSPG